MPENQQLHEGERLRNFLKGSGRKMGELAETLEMTTQNLHYHLRKQVLDRDFVRLLRDKTGIDARDLTEGKQILPLENSVNEPQLSPGEELRRKKAFGETKRGLKAVPIVAQAGYIQHFLDPVFIDDLQTFDMPGLPYFGPNYRLFQVSGDSMETYNQANRPEGLSDGMWVIAKKIEPDYWHHTFDFFVHIIVTDTRIMVKRLKREKYENHPDRYYFVCISDNEDVYPQFTLDPSEIRELWEVERKIDWNIPPPKRFEITIKRDAPPGVK